MTQSKFASMESIRQAFLEKKDYEGYLCMYGGHERLRPLVEIHTEIPDSEYWKCLRAVWYNIEVSHPHREIWLFLWRGHGRGCRETLMEKEERDRLNALPDVITIYRGHAKGKARRGLSWTLSREVAERFATYAVGGRRSSLCGHTKGASAMVATGKCHKNDIIALFSDRKEEEIVIDPSTVFGLRSRRVDS